jgi:UV DNA damage repair endonuclease
VCVCVCVCVCVLSLNIKMFNKYSFVFLRDTRSSVLEESLRKLGVEKLSKEDVQKMAWEVLEAKIGNWIHFMRIAVSTCLEFEQILHFPCSEYIVMLE